MIDSHCHLDGFYKNGELLAVLERAEASGVRQFVATGTNPEDWEIYRALAEAFPQKIFYTVGLHPTEIPEGEDERTLLSLLEKYFCTGTFPQPVAMGEIGLDRHRLPADSHEASCVCALQEKMFLSQLALAKKIGVPVVVHSREAFAETVEAIDASGVDWRKVNFHCFSEDEAQIRLVNARGGRASFTGTLTYKNAENVRRAARAQGVERTMLETDCPYLAPQGFRGKRNEPAYLRATAVFAAELFGGMSVEALDEVTSANARSFFALGEKS